MHYLDLPDIDRALPNIPEREASATVYPFGGSAPYEQLDRALPDIVVGERTRFAAVQGDTRSDAEIAVKQETTSFSFANDPHFVAPPQ
jgi:hypothetical protein